MQRPPARFASRAPGVSQERPAAGAAPRRAPGRGRRRAPHTNRRREQRAGVGVRRWCSRMPRKRRRWTPTLRLRTIDSSCRLAFRPSAIVYCDGCHARRSGWAVGLTGCAGSDEATKPVTYSLTAKQNYEKGLAELKDENYPEAEVFPVRQAEVPVLEVRGARRAGARRHAVRARQLHTRPSTATRASRACTRRTKRCEDGYVAFRVGESYVKDMPEDVWFLPPAYEKDQSAVATPCASWRFLKKYPDFAIRRRRRKTAAPQVLQAPGRPRGLRGPLLPRPRPPQSGGAAHRGRHPALSGVGSRGGAAAGRWAQTYLQMGDPQRAQGHLQRVVSEYGRRRRRAAPSCIWISSSSDTATNPQPSGRRRRTRAATDRAEWMNGPARAARARARHTTRREYEKAERCLTQVVRESTSVCGRLRHAGGHLSPRGG